MTPAAAAGNPVDILASSLAGAERWLALLGFFGAGIALAFTPCTLPMLPILSGLIAGRGGRAGARHGLLLSVIYVFAGCAVFVGAGIAAALAGARVQATLQAPWVIGAFAGVFVTLALGLFGAFTLAMPASLRRWASRASAGRGGGSLAGAAAMGALSSLIVGPCMAPPLAGALLYVADTGDPWFGGLALCALNLGMGVPLIAFGTALARWLPRAGAWMGGVQRGFGWLFLGLAVWLLARVLPVAVVMTLAGLVLVGAGTHLQYALRGGTCARRWRLAGQLVALALLAAGSLEFVGLATGSRSAALPLSDRTAAAAPATAVVRSSAELDAVLAAARTAGRPALLDFYASWCTSCSEMERSTFRDPAVREALAAFVVIKADVTRATAEDATLLARFDLFGPPGTVFFGQRDGAEQRALRLVGFERASAFLARLAEARER